MATLPFKVKALYEYTSEHDDDLNFAPGQVMTVTEIEGDDWFVGEYLDDSGKRKEGLFPANFVERHEPEIPTRPNRPMKPKQEKEVQRPLSTVPMEVPGAVSALEDVGSNQMVAVTTAEQSVGDSSKDKITGGSSHERTGDPVSLQTKSSNRDVGLADVAADAKPAPPPVAPKSSSFKDRIAAFNKFEQAPIKPFQPSTQSQAGSFIKKPFVPPPPTATSYIPQMPRNEPVQPSYRREEDPEIREKVEQDQAAAEAAGLANATQKGDGSDEAEQQKPMSLKERMALLQEQQRLQAERNADAAQRKEKKPSAKKPQPSEDSHMLEASDDGVDKGSAEDGIRDQETRDSVHERGSEASGSRTTHGLTAASSTLPNATSLVTESPEHHIGDDVPDTSDEQHQIQHDTGDAEEEADHELTYPQHALGASHPRQGAGRTTLHDADVQPSDVDEEAQDAVEEMDEEELRKQRLRERMARLAGPQGGVAMPFNPFAPSIPMAASKASREARADDPGSLGTRKPQAPTRMRSETQKVDPVTSGRDLPDVDAADAKASVAGVNEPSGQSGESHEHYESAKKPDTKAPTNLTGRPILPPRASLDLTTSIDPAEDARSYADTLPQRARPAPPPPVPSSSAPLSPGPGSESDDEMSMHAKRSSAETSGVETPLPIENNRAESILRFQVQPTQDTHVTNEEVSEKAMPRSPPPIPGTAGTFTRPAPPPPPPETGDENMRRHQPLPKPEHSMDDSEGSDYEGDYDTDIASGESHKDALKAHVRGTSLDEKFAADQSEPPTKLAPRSLPPPPPGPSKPKASMEQPRAPPPVPTNMPQAEDYDPYRYAGTNQMIGDNQQDSSRRPTLAVQDESSADEPNHLHPEVPVKISERSIPSGSAMISGPSRLTQSSLPAQATQDSGPTRQPPIAPSQQPGLVSRRSIDQGRASGESGQMARDLDLRLDVTWWTTQRPLPPSLQARDGIDILSESEELVTTRRGGRSLISKDIYILYVDYSQTVITVRYDPRDPVEASVEQRHEAPPGQLRQDQLEAYWARFGSQIGQAARTLSGSKKESVVGDGTPQALPLELIKPLAHALLPVGARAYGAIVYANLANASTMQFDEIRAGDIMTLRNARFEGHHGPLKQKYKSEYVNHIAVVDEWDGTKRSVRAWEQGRDKKPAVRSEKFRLGDLRSGEVRIWRVVARDWVGWDESM